MFKTKDKAKTKPKAAAKRDGATLLGGAPIKPGPAPAPTVDPTAYMEPGFLYPEDWAPPTPPSDEEIMAARQSAVEECHDDAIEFIKAAAATCRVEVRPFAVKLCEHFPIQFEDALALIEEVDREWWPGKYEAIDAAAAAAIAVEE